MQVKTILRTKEHQKIGQALCGSPLSHQSADHISSSHRQRRPSKPFFDVIQQRKPDVNDIMCGSGLLVERGNLLAASRSGPALTGRMIFNFYVYVPYMYMYILLIK
jgi:hypothetical protein